MKRGGVGLRRRLFLTLIGVVAVTVAVVGTISVFLVDRSLRQGLVSESLATTEFNLAILAPAAGVGEDPTPFDVASSGLLQRFLNRGLTGAWASFDDGQTVAAGAGPYEVAGQLAAIADSGEIGYQFTPTTRGEVLVTAARLPTGGPVFYFATSADAVTGATRQVMAVTAGAGVATLLIGALVASTVAGRMLRPVAAAQEAAERMAAGDLNVRLSGEGRDELGRLSAAFNRMAASLQGTINELDAARLREKRFVADVSHELKTPLTGLVNEAGMLRQRLQPGRPATPDDAAIAEMLNTDVGRMRRLVDDLLEVSRLDADASVPSLSLVDLNAFLSALIADRHPSTRLESTLDRPLTTDPRGLERIVGNLLDNAAVHAEGAATLVSAGLTDENLEITVLDDGPGVPEKALASLFDRFATAESARGKGTGLGLAIAAQHAHRLGGEIRAVNRPGGGLEVRVRLPVAELLHGSDADVKPIGEPYEQSTNGDTP